jgi:hypothetical protein
MDVSAPIAGLVNQGNDPHGLKSFPIVDGTYTGYIDDEGRPHGKGQIAYRSGDAFDGLFTNGSRTYGTLLLTNGIQYCGDFVDDVPGGKGTITWPHKFVFHGTHKNFVFESGEYKWPDGDRHEGAWENNVPAAKGLRKYKSGARSKGDLTVTRKCLNSSLYRVVFTRGSDGSRIEETWDSEVNARIAEVVLTQVK